MQLPFLFPQRETIFDVPMANMIGLDYLGPMESKDLTNIFLMNKIQELRRKRKWSVSKAAQRLGIPISTYREWERGRRLPAEALLKIADLYEVPLSYFSNRPELKEENIKKAIYYLEAGLEFLKNL